MRRVDQLRSGEPIAGDGHTWLNLIHVDDAADAAGQAATAMIKNSAISRAEFLVSDDRPVRRSEYYGYLARLADAATPQFDASINARISGMGKRCRNEAAKRELELTLRYPTYIEGLWSCVRSARVREPSSARHNSGRTVPT